MVKEDNEEQIQTNPFTFLEYVLALYWGSPDRL